MGRGCGLATADGASGGEDAGEGVVAVAAGMDGEGVAFGLVEPGDENDLVAFLGALECGI